MWNGLMKILEIEHVNKNGVVLWKSKNVNNIFHKDGEYYCLSALFSGEPIPANYYIGLDAREEPSVDDTLAELHDEPSTNGYERQAASSTNWSVSLVNEVNRAVGPIVTFQAGGGAWGPVTNLFLSTTANNSGFLVASIILNEELTVNNGDSINLRAGMSLRDYSC